MSRNKVYNGTEQNVTVKLDWETRRKVQKLSVEKDLSVSLYCKKVIEKHVGDKLPD